MLDEEQFAAPWICLTMMRLGSRMAARFDEEFAEQGITQAQFRMLLAIHFEGGAEGIAPGVLADHLLIERATVSALAARLCERGLLARMPGKNRRTHNLIVTPEGREVLGRVAPRAVALSRHVLAGMTPNGLQSLKRALETLEARIREASLAERVGEGTERK